jgi:hypothetical protein
MMPGRQSAWKGLRDHLNKAGMEMQMKYRISFFSLMLCIAMVIPVSAEYYQYRDKDGNLHFTDNKAEIPEEALDRAKSFDSADKDKSVSPSEREHKKDSEQATMPDPNTWDGKIRIEADELDREKEKLDQTFRRLQEEKAALQKQNPNQMTTEERSAYKDRLHDLNERITRYHQKQKQFEEKVDKFNDQLRKNSATESSGIENEP